MLRKGTRFEGASKGHPLTADSDDDDEDDEDNESIDMAVANREELEENIRPVRMLLVKVSFTQAMINVAKGHTVAL